jgi:DNA-binding PadR family transcriptional regulator
MNRKRRFFHHNHFRMPHSIPRGLLRFLILKMLQSKAMTGAEIMQILEERSRELIKTGEEHSEEVWKPSPGSIYPLLKKLNEAGFIEPVEEQSKTYKLSEEGLAHLKEFHKKKGELTHKARLGRMLWLQLLDPTDQMHFHMMTLQTGVEFLTNLVDSLTSTERETLRTHIEEIIENLTALGNMLT